MNVRCYSSVATLFLFCHYSTQNKQFPGILKKEKRITNKRPFVAKLDFSMPVSSFQLPNYLTVVSLFPASFQSVRVPHLTKNVPTHFKMSSLSLSFMLSNAKSSWLP